MYKQAFGGRSISESKPPAQLSRKSQSSPRTQRIAEILPESIPQLKGVSVSLRSSSTRYCSSIRRAAACAVVQISAE
jgi:hypothetical protein